MAQKELLSRITVKSVYGAIKTVIKEVADPVSGEKTEVRVLERETPLMRVYGQANEYQVVDSTYGASLRFLGVFKAINADTGEVFTSGKCFLPGVIESQLGGVLDSVKEGGVEFAFDIVAVPSKNAYGYEYRVRSVIEVAEAPVITALEQRMGMLSLPNKLEEADKSAHVPEKTAAPEKATGKKK